MHSSSNVVCMCACVCVCVCVLARVYVLCMCVRTYMCCAHTYVCLIDWWKVLKSNNQTITDSLYNVLAVVEEG